MIPFQTPAAYDKIDSGADNFAVFEINRAFNFVSQYNELENYYRNNNPIQSANLCLNMEMLFDKCDKKGVINDSTRGQILAKEVIQKTNNSNCFINLIEIAEEKTNKESLSLQKKLSFGKKLSNIKLTQSQYFSKKHSFNLEQDQNKFLSNQANFVEGTKHFINPFSTENLENTESYWKKTSRSKVNNSNEETPFWRKSNQSPTRESQKEISFQFGNFSENYLAQMKGLRVETKRNGVLTNYHQSNESSSRTLDTSNLNESISYKPPPYFQFSFKRLERSHSPNSGNKEEFKVIIDSEIKKVSLAKKHQLEASIQTTLSHKNTESSLIKKNFTNNNSNMCSQGAKVSSARSKAIIVDASKRYRLPKSPSKIREEFDSKESQNLKER